MVNNIQLAKALAAIAWLSLIALTWLFVLSLVQNYLVAGISWAFFFLLAIVASALAAGKRDAS